MQCVPLASGANLPSACASISNPFGLGLAQPGRSCNAGWRLKPAKRFDGSAHLVHELNARSGEISFWKCPRSCPRINYLSL